MVVEIWVEPVNLSILVKIARTDAFSHIGVSVPLQNFVIFWECFQMFLFRHMKIELPRFL